MADIVDVDMMILLDRVGQKLNIFQYTISMEPFKRKWNGFVKCSEKIAYETKDLDAVFMQPLNILCKLGSLVILVTRYFQQFNWCYFRDNCVKCEAICYDQKLFAHHTFIVWSSFEINCEPTDAKSALFFCSKICELHTEFS